MEKVRRVQAALGPYGPVMAGVLLTLLAVVESVARSGGLPALSQTETVPVGVPIPPGPTVDDGTVIILLLALATTLPLPLLWTQPTVAAVVLCGAGLLSATAFHTFTTAGLIAQLVAGYRLGRHRSQATAVLAAVPFPVLAVALEVGGGPRALDGPDDVRLHAFVLLLACLAPVAALAGIARRSRGQAVADTAARQVIADSLLEHTARGERARIARELHDVVAHHISMVAVQAETARLAVPGMPEAGAQRLLAIGDTARAALTEMRRLLGVLREDADEAAATWRPQPGLRLHELNELLDESRAASGTSTRLTLRGAPVELDPGVELAAYRIIQEALTNARRHAPGAAVDVELDYTGDDLRVLVRDNGPGPPTDGGGHGLSGMRERAAAVGGELRTGPATGGGFRVEARLPGREESTG
ncbi:sensor histidine kinase [Nonomuraea sp. NPDC046802]|uniref:sensor histidine kinase n=1 Tax=Nonomuraea sp. NPDC046802 TaxID=3154919 RepID=UPI0033E121EC